MPDAVDVRVAARDFIYEGETYLRDEQLTVDEQTFENHQRSLKPVDENGGGGENAAESKGGGADADAGVLEEINGVGPSTAGKLRDAGYESFGDLREASADVLADVDSVSESLAEDIRDQLIEE